MDAFKKGFGFMNVDRDENRNNGNNSSQRHQNNTIQPRFSISQTLAMQSQSPSSSNNQEGLVKTKLMSAWNSVKYGNLMSQLDIKPSFSKNSPVWMLGEAYHRKLAVDMDPISLMPVGNQVRTFNERPSDAGIEAFEVDFSSRIWLTYRKDLQEFRGTKLNTDCGWGCMIRSGQMMLAQAIVLHWLGRNWRWSNTQTGIISAEHWKTERLHRAIIQLFSDAPDDAKSPLSIHKLVGLGRAAGKQPGEWFGPSSVSHLLAMAVKQSPRGQGLLDDLAVYVASDCTVYRQDIEDLCSAMPPKCQGCTHSNNCKDCDHQPRGGEVLEDFSIIDIPNKSIGQQEAEVEEATQKYSLTEEVVIDGESWCMERESSRVPSVDLGSPPEHPPYERWKAVVVLIPVRLGGEHFNPIYSNVIKTLLTQESCIGIIGGRPRHSLYFIGFQDDNLINLDPHRLQPKVDTDILNFPLESFHCNSPRKMAINRMDPSSCIGFYLRTRSEFDDWCKGITELVTPSSGSSKTEYPMFIVAEGRSREHSEDWVKLNDDHREFSKDSLGEAESEEFVFL